MSDCALTSMFFFSLSIVISDIRTLTPEHDPQAVADPQAVPDPIKFKNAIIHASVALVTFDGNDM